MAFSAPRLSASADHPEVPRLSASADQKNAPRRARLRKKQNGGRHARVEVPERLRDSDDDADDEQTSQAYNMNQSIFGVIAAAGARVDFNERFDGSSSEDEDTGPSQDASGEDMSQSTMLQRPSKGKKQSQHHSRKISGSRLLRSLPILPKLKSKKRREKSKLSSEASEEKPDETRESEETSSAVEPPSIKLTREDSRLAPVMSRMLEARAEVSPRPSFDIERPSLDASGAGGDDGGASPLAKRLMYIFEFEQPEEVIEGLLPTALPLRDFVLR